MITGSVIWRSFLVVLMSAIFDTIIITGHALDPFPSSRGIYRQGMTLSLVSDRLVAFDQRGGQSEREKLRRWEQQGP